jgi:hypothetical protein
MSNFGVLKVATVGTDSAKIFVNGTFKAKDVSAIDLDGNMIITGNFIQDATRPAFVSAEYAGETATDKTSTGVFTFRSDFAAGTRVHQITTSNNAATHNRGEQFLTFPNILFDTNDTIVLTSYMGIDAKSIKTVAGKGGKLLLASNVQVAGDGAPKVYDASLRFPGATTPADVPAGTIAIERNVQLYRSGTNLNAFAAPFTNQRSGYFAGNWVRNPIINSSGYVMYPLANAMDAQGHIYPEYYVIDPRERFLTGQPYLIRYNDATYDYDDEHDLLVTGGMTGQSTKPVYLFNGSPYNLGHENEQIVTNEALYNHTLTTQTASTAKYIVVGNSYSAPISVEKLVTKLLSTGIGFAKYLYYFPAGSQNYIQMDMSQAVSAFPIKYIPSQSVFMVRQTGAGGQLVLDKSLTVQARASNNLSTNGSGGTYAPALNQVADEDYQPNLLRFKVSPSDNENIYDLAAVFVRHDASDGSDKYDMHKFANNDNGSFSMSMRDEANVRHLQMGVPLTAASANMTFRPAVYGGNYILTASNVENMATQAVVLEDKKTNTFTDLRENPTYEFEGNASDFDDRFVVHFVPQSPTSVSDVTEGAINAYYNNNNSIVVNKLNEKDINSAIEVMDMQGRVVLKDVIKSYPSQSVDAYMADGVYIISVKGARNYTGKVVVK